VEGISRNAIKLLKDFKYVEEERPILAQVFGIEVECFYDAAIIVSTFGFDGIDINMGCPAKKVHRRGSGAALIQNPKLASEIIEATLSGVRDFKNGRTIEDLKLKSKMKEEIYKEANKHKRKSTDVLSVSVKTRIGYEESTVEEWISHLVKHDIQAISVHGRTLKQMYSGQANWEEIAKAAKIVKSANKTIIGNGDIKNLEEAKEKINKYNLDGVLVGRATFGNPWFFSGKEPTLKDRIDLAVYHSEEFEKMAGENVFYAMRKHLGWYLKGFPNAKDIRSRLFLTNSSKEVREILEEIDLN
jgi:nifR3 family TIM-barrel protein